MLYNMDQFKRNWSVKPDFRGMLRGMPWVACLAIALFGCRSSDGLSDRWETYRNPRYGFEFLYPAGWQAADLPENRDGAAFRNPQDPQVEIRGWASFLRVSKTATAAPKVASPTRSSRPAKSLTSKARQTQVPAPSSSSLPPTNFTTEQGIQGTLQADLEAQTSSLTLVLNRGNIQYYLRGSAPSQQFDEYYRFFNYVARRYRIPKSLN